MRILGFGGNQLATAGGYEVANSLRFNEPSSDKLTRSNGTPTSQQKFTHSVWVKRSTVGNFDIMQGFYSDSNNYCAISFLDSDRLDFINYEGSTTVRKITTAKFRDVSAWYHICVAVDTTQGTANDRVKMYVNGVLQTVFDANTAPSQNANLGVDLSTQAVGVGEGGGIGYLQGYLAESVYIDGQQLDPTSFGEFDSDSGIWKPIDVSGLTFGTNGFYLDYEDSSALGNDAAGSNNFTVNNLTATDQTTDTCTNNFATLNPLMNNLNNLPTLSEGNLEVLAVSGSTWSVTPSTIGLPKKGKWVFEVEAVSGTGGDRAAFAGWMNPAVSNPLANGSILWRNVASTNSILSNDSPATGSFSATTWGTNGNIIGMYIDMDNSKMYFTHNGTVQNSGTGIDFQGTFDDDTFILPVVMVINTDKLSVNFGNPAANFAIASGNTDVNGFGNFEFDPSAGTFDGASKDFLAICTKNLAGVS